MDRRERGREEKNGKERHIRRAYGDEEPLKAPQNTLLNLSPLYLIHKHGWMCLVLATRWSPSYWHFPHRCCRKSNGWNTVSIFPNSTLSSDLQLSEVHRCAFPHLAGFYIYGSPGSGKAHRNEQLGLHGRFECGRERPTGAESPVLRRHDISQL